MYDKKKEIEGEKGKEEEEKKQKEGHLSMKKIH